MAWEILEHFIPLADVGQVEVRIQVLKDSLQGIFSHEAYESHIVDSDAEWVKFRMYFQVRYSDYIVWGIVRQNQFGRICPRIVGFVAAKEDKSQSSHQPEQGREHTFPSHPTKIRGATSGTCPVN